MQKIAIIGNFPPRQCGIATFTNDLNDGIKSNGISTSIIAMNDGLRKYNYPSDVKYEIEQNEIGSYLQAADFINAGNFDAVVLQHEFGIFGGKDGRHIVQLLKRVKKPVFTTLHTILDTPSEGQRYVFKEIANLSEKIVSISKKGIQILEDVYGIPPSKCTHIHHGAHKTSDNDVNKLKHRFGVESKKVLLTFGLLSRNKSIEVVINALPAVVKKHPDLLYIILGATHPHVLKHEGETYRHSLMELVNELGLGKNILFIDRFVSNKELFEFLTVCEIYIIPYLGQKQISSGTLIYAMGAGKPVISTPFWYAEEMLDENRGILFDFNDSEQLTENVLYLLDNEDKKNIIAQNALTFAEQCYWPKIGKQYMELLKTIPVKKKVNSLPNSIEKPAERDFSLPPININHLRLLTDSTGILQHTRYTIPDRTHGYCLDDNSRALILSVMLQNHTEDINELYRLSSIYLSFIDYAYNYQKGKFRNFMSYERKWLEEEGSEDSVGRAVWALGYTAAYSESDSFYNHSNHLFRKAIEDIEYISHPRALAYLILGLTCHARIHGEEEVIRLLEKKAKQLSAFFDTDISNEEWPWYDGIVTYANSRIPHALITAGMYLEEAELTDRGLKLLDWLIEMQFADGIFMPVGNDGWMTRERKAVCDQQPVEAHGMIDACLAAKQFTKNEKYAQYALTAFEWFTGKNTCSSRLYDHSTGGCRDGLHSDRVNLNQGAESTLSWLMSLVRMSYYLQDTNQLK